MVAMLRLRHVANKIVDIQCGIKDLASVIETGNSSESVLGMLTQEVTTK